MGSLRLFSRAFRRIRPFRDAARIPNQRYRGTELLRHFRIYTALALNEKYGPGSYWLFASNRLLRLWPTYIVALVLSFAIADNWRPIAS